MKKRKFSLFSFCFLFFFLAASTTASLAIPVEAAADAIVSPALYVLAADSDMAMAGLRGSSIIFSHSLPNCLSPIIVNLTLRVAGAIISASSLSFLGLGVPEPAPEWGSLLSAGRQLIREYSYLTMFPGLAILITVLALNMMGDGLRDAMDPKLRK